MLPSGHIVGGFLVGTAVAKWVFPEVIPGFISFFACWGAFWGFAPDLDEFWFFYKNKNLLVAPAKVEKYHRNFFTHAPLLWLILASITAVFWPHMGTIIWLGSWSHFLLDSIEYGIPWLWPFSEKLYALKGAGVAPFVIEEKNFFRHSLKFLQQYAKTTSFYLEILIIIIAIFVYFK